MLTKWMVVIPFPIFWCNLLAWDTVKGTLAFFPLLTYFSKELYVVWVKCNATNNFSIEPFFIIPGKSSLTFFTKVSSRTISAIRAARPLIFLSPLNISSPSPSPEYSIILCSPSTSLLGSFVVTGGILIVSFFAVGQRATESRFPCFPERESGTSLRNGKA